MSIQELGSLGEFVAAIATIATLVYLALEIRRNTAATRSSAHQTQVDSAVGLHSMLTNDPDVAELVVKANSDPSSLSAGENLRLQYFYISHFNLWHSAYWNMNEGLLSDHVWNAWDKAMTLVMKNQLACRQAWNQTAEIYDDQFQKHVFEILKATKDDTSEKQGWGHHTAT